MFARRSLGRLALVAGSSSSRHPAVTRLPCCCYRSSSNSSRISSQSTDSNFISFPGALKSAFTSTLKFVSPESFPSLATYRVVDQHGAVVDESFKPDLSDEEVVKLYEDMVYISVLDPIMYDAQRQGRLSFYLVSAGEEAVSVGSASALTMDDVIFSQYREQGVFRQRGFTTADFMAQLTANKHDAGKGRNMPVHYGSRELNIHTISSPLATQLPQAVGTAYSLKMKRRINPSLPGRVAVAYFGEGAASEGDFHAALNLAATRSCPVIFICRNNGYAISTPSLEQYRGDGIGSRGIGYGIHTIRVDGNDFWAVREATKHARRVALGEDGSGEDIASAGGTTCKPVLVEAMTYRVSHHSTSDDSFAYRARVEVDDWKRRDNPITRLRKWMESRGLWDDAKEHEARGRMRTEILRAFTAAEREKKPALRTMFEDVYEQPTPDLVAQREELKKMVERYPQEYDVSEFEGGKDGL